MQKIVLTQFGPATHLDAAYVIDQDGRIGAYIAEPEARNGEGGMVSPTWDEAAFRAAVEAEVASWEARNPGEKLWIQYDPGRDDATEVEVGLQG